MSPLQSTRRRLIDRLLGLAAASALVALGVLAAVAFLASRMRDELKRSSEVVIEEQRITDRVVGGVMRQLITVSTATDRSEAVIRRDFENAGVAVHDGLRSYLFRELSPAERLQIEHVREEHLALEVAALRVTRLARDGDLAVLADANQMLERHSVNLLASLETFARMREADLQGAFARQALLFRQFVFIGGGLLLLTGVLAALALVRFTRRRVTAPLEQLAQASVQLGAGGSGVRVRGEHDQEFFEVAQRFNAMGLGLADARSGLELRNAELEAALAQVRTTQADLVQAEKLGALGRMTAGLAHELNNPLASVLGFSQLLAADLAERGDIPAEELTARYVAPLTREANRAHHLVRSLLQFSRRAGADVGAVSVRDALDLASDLRRYSFEQAGLKLTIDTPPDVLVVAEQQRLQGTFLNIINNAYDAMLASGEGELRIASRVVAGRLELCFDDTGPGIADPSLVFEPFYTTKGVGEGTGLGLALVNRFVESFGGTIAASNRPAGGARFELSLKVAEHAGTAPPPESALLPRVDQPTTRQVLVVEDEEELRRLASQVLGRLGVRVHLAASAAEARDVLMRHEIDAVVSDVMMPGENGVELYRWVEREQPHLATHFLFVTGDIGAPVVREMASRQPGAFLQKPYDLHEYLNRVAALLSRPTVS